MQIHIIAVGNKMPDWVTAGFHEYAKRIPTCKLIEIPAEKRTKTTSIHQLKEREGEKILAAIHSGNRVIALEVLGKTWSTETLAKNINDWQTDGRDLDLLIGGPDGLSSACLKRADIQWSLSPLTLPHPLVRIVVVEQIYRAFSILQGHPYHR